MTELGKVIRATMDLGSNVDSELVGRSQRLSDVVGGNARQTVVR
jgi:hypothetical protein